MLVERKLFLDVGKQRIDLVRVCIVNGRGDHGHGESSGPKCETRLPQISNIIRGKLFVIPLVNVRIISGFPETCNPEAKVADLH